MPGEDETNGFFVSCFIRRDATSVGLKRKAEDEELAQNKKKRRKNKPKKKKKLAAATADVAPMANHPSHSDSE